MFSGELETVKGLKVILCTLSSFNHVPSLWHFTKHVSNESGKFEAIPIVKLSQWVANCSDIVKGWYDLV